MRPLCWSSCALYEIRRVRCSQRLEIVEFDQFLAKLCLHNRSGATSAAALSYGSQPVWGFIGLRRLCLAIILEISLRSLY